MLTDAAIKNLKSKDKPYKVTDRDGMYVRVGTNGTISFRYDYRVNGRQETVTFGKYGLTGLSLARAREKCIDARRMIQEGLSPAIEKQREKRKIKEATVAAKCCGQGIREKIWALSFIDQPRWVRVDAIDALIMADVVEHEIIDAITAKLILRLAPPLAASATILLAAHGSVDVVVRIMERIAHSTKHRALLLVGAWALAERDHGAAAGLLELLDPDHPGKRLLDLGQDELLPNTVLNDLGDARIRKAVRNWLKDSIAKD